MPKGRPSVEIRGKAMKEKTNSLLEVPLTAITDIISVGSGAAESHQNSIRKK